jgi:hypothetical protein
MLLFSDGLSVLVADHEWLEPQLEVIFVGHGIKGE